MCGCLPETVESASLRATLHVSVPCQEAPWAEQFLVGAEAAVTARPLSAAVVAENAEVRVLSISSQDTLDLSLVEELGGLQAVVTRSTGFDHLPLEGLRGMGVRAYHLDDYASRSVAEHTLLFLLMLLRRVPEATWATGGRSGPPVWDRTRLQGRGLGDVTVGVLGTGRIGSRVVRLLCGLGVEVVGYDLVPDPLLVKVKGFRYVGSLRELLGASDALTIHVPLNEDTRVLIGAQALDALPEGAVVVNTARGAVVDEQEVARRLRDGRLGGYAADVLTGEPKPTQGLTLFRDLSNVVLTPHLAAYDEAALHARYQVTAKVTGLIVDGDAVALERYSAPA
jgi:phosphoglycerate dehydrogenase-like enzyme